MIALLILLNAYFVSFTDKPLTGDPALSPRAIEQRAKWNIPTNELDYPVDATYVDSICHLGAELCHTSRWFNGATVLMDEETADTIAQLSFVQSVEITRDNSSPRPWFAPWRVQQIAEQTTANQTDAQLNLYNLPPLHEAGFEGQGILMTVCDGGFYDANTVGCFRQSELELGHFDFTDDTDDFYGSTGTHGTECLSAISGIQSGFYGAATKAQYYLMRSEEDVTESPKEMDNLVSAFEKADSLGVNIFSVSLGYSMFDNNNWDLPKTSLDGKSTRVSKAATIAARKGMLICVAAGNEGDGSWHTISAPADADSVLTVGAVSTSGRIGDFSSYGPSADGRIKPEVCAVGVRATLVAPNGTIVTSNGTSFATPLLAGLAASLWSALPSENAMQIRDRIIASSDHVDNPDRNQYGYGIPNAWKAYTMYAEGIGNVKDEVESRKILRNGQILIIRQGRIYNVSGQRIE